MGLLKKILGKARPQAIDMLVFQFPEETPIPTVPMLNRASLQQSGNEFTIIEDGILVHRSRVFFKSNLLSNFGFSKPLMTIGDCLTDDRYRGKGIYPEVIRYLGSKFSKERRVYILVAPDNIPSIRGIEKAGFTFLTRLQAYRFLIFYLRKNDSSSRS